MPRPFRDSLLERARRTAARIVFPEGHDARIREAAERLSSLGIGNVTVLGAPTPDAPRPQLKDAPTPDALRPQLKEAPTPDAPRPQLMELLRRRKPDRFPDDRTATEALNDPLLYGACLVGVGAADVMVGGADRPTGDVIRAALLAVGTAPGMSSVSGAFYMARGERVLTFADCAVIPEPTPEQLAEIARAAARDRRRIVGDEPVVAFLSYGTKGSAAGPRVARVDAAVECLRRGGADFAFDGGLQGDAALVADVARRKAPGSAAAGRANVLVFPDLDSGNIAYKLVQRLGEWTALGPILQGLARPIADLSRGATVDDIVETTAIAVLQT